MPRPPEPLEGLVSIAEFGNKVQADVALGALLADGFDATLSFDPALSSAAPYFASDRTFELVVREEDVAAAVAVLEQLTTDLPDEFSEAHAVDHRRSPRRTRVRRIALFLVIAWFSVPVLLMLLVQVLSR